MLGKKSNKTVNNEICLTSTGLEAFFYIQYHSLYTEKKILFVCNAQKTKSINEALITTTVTKIKNISTDI